MGEHGLLENYVTSFFADNADTADLTFMRGGFNKAIDSGRPFMAQTQLPNGNFHAVVVDGIQEINGSMYTIIRDPAVGTYAESLDWFLEQSLAPNKPLLWVK